MQCAGPSVLAASLSSKSQPEVEDAPPHPQVTCTHVKWNSVGRQFIIFHDGNTETQLGYSAAPRSSLQPAASESLANVTRICSRRGD